MASRSGGISLGVKAAGSRALARSAALSAGVLCGASAYASGANVSTSTNWRNRMPAMPRRGDPIGWVEIDGKRLQVTFDQALFNFLEDMHVRRLGGSNAPTITDIASDVVTAKSVAVEATTAVTGVEQQGRANAESLATSVQVLQNNGLAGSHQIPPVQRTSTLAL